MLAVTSDKLTLHIFDLPPQGQSTEGARTSKAQSSVNLGLDEDQAKHKWGIFGKIPFLPRVFSDEYSFAAAPFSDGGESAADADRAASQPSIPGLPRGRPGTGHIGWQSDTVLIVVGAGRNARWERFEIVVGEEGKRYCLRRGWKRYLGA